MPTAFVTGASGFVGANLVRALLDRDWRVRALVRGEAPSLAGLDVEGVPGDLFAPELPDAMRGCDALFHLAATYSLWRRDRDELLRANVEGTRNVLAAARAAGIPRSVHTSSVAAIGVRADGRPADETYQSPPERLIGAYKRSKYLAEQEVHAAVAGGQDVVIVNPTTPVGPWDAKPTPTGEILVRFLNRRMPAYVDTGLNLVDVRDVAAGHVLAYERGRAGERYILGNENVTLRGLLDRLAGLTGLPAPRVRLPLALPLAYAALGELVLARFGYVPDVALDGVRMAKQRMFYATEKADSELGAPRSPIDTALADAVTWFRGHGYVKPGRQHSEDGWRSLSSKP
ncbi:MAG TPA: hopanoid-associated sugar epimerase [Candidatus Elarobacter sp.]|nr:hopanoid-associated sugar epimerase [Candidatus Elarobacter sp.]